MGGEMVRQADFVLKCIENRAFADYGATNDTDTNLNKCKTLKVRLRDAIISF